MTKIATIVGARPQFIKAAVVSREIRSVEGLVEVLIHTGQHYDRNMSDLFFEELDLPAPDYHLGIGSGPHGRQTGQMLERIEAVLVEERPDWVLVYGDTNSTLAGALAAAKLHVPVAHVEAGLRSFNRRMPEEVNRVLTDHCSELLFAPTETAVANLRNEGFPDQRIEQVGDVMYDAARDFARRAEERRDVLDRFGLHPREYVLATVHRAENTDVPERLAAILSGLRETASRVPVLMPLHPRTRQALEALDRPLAAHEGLRLVDPVGYLDMVLLERNARCIVTDSGGVQKEAYFHGVPCIILRDETEWVELLELGWSRLVAPTTAKAVCDAVLESLDRRGSSGEPYGSGDSGLRIVRRLCEVGLPKNGPRS